MCGLFITCTGDSRICVRIFNYKSTVALLLSEKLGRVMFQLFPLFTLVSVRLRLTQICSLIVSENYEISFDFNIYWLLYHFTMLSDRHKF